MKYAIYPFFVLSVLSLLNTPASAKDYQISEPQNVSEMVIESALSAMRMDIQRNLIDKRSIVSYNQQILVVLPQEQGQKSESAPAETSLAARRKSIAD
ncbi:MAG: hypothetical protein AAGB12_00330 [Pseudomonadota bacterium]